MGYTTFFFGRLECLASQAVSKFLHVVIELLGQRDQVPCLVLDHSDFSLHMPLLVETRVWSAKNRGTSSSHQALVLLLDFEGLGHRKSSLRPNQQKRKYHEGRGQPETKTDLHRGSKFHWNVMFATAPHAQSKLTSHCCPASVHPPTHPKLAIQ